MATITTNTTITLPAGQMLVFGLGGSATAIIDGNVYELGLGEKFFGPFTVSESVQVVVRSGTITYSIETDGAASREVTQNPITRQLASDSTDAVRGAAGISGLAAMYRGRTPGRLCTVGTSWADGAGASTTDKCFRKLLENRYAGRLTPENCARGGAGAEYHVTDTALNVNANKALGPGDIVVYEAGFNDYNIGDGSPKHLNYWEKVFMATLAWWCVPQRVDSQCSRLSLYDHTAPSLKRLTTSPNVTTTGSWTVGYGSGSGNRRMCLSGTTATFTGEGDMVYVIRWRGATGTASVHQITVDGVAMDVDNSRGTYAVTSFVPYLERYPVSPGQHTVTVTGSVFPSEVFIFYRGKVPAQTVLVQPCHDVRLDARVDNSNTTSTSLSLTAPNAWWWDEGLLDRLKQRVRKCVEVMRYDGWEIGIVENGNWDPMIHTADAGSGASPTYHPNDRGHYQLYLPLADAVDRILGDK
jgi:hypothetical protein